MWFANDRMLELGCVLVRTIGSNLAFEVAYWHRAAEQMPLGEVHPKYPQPLELFAGLHPFGSDGYIEATREGHDRRYDRRRFVAFHETTDERLVDLNLVERKRRQAAQRRITGAEVVKRQRNSDALEFLNEGKIFNRSFHQARLGALSFQPPRPNHRTP